MPVPDFIVFYIYCKITIKSETGNSKFLREIVDGQLHAITIKLGTGRPFGKNR